MPLYQYIKEQPKKRMKTPRVISFFFIIAGLTVLSWVLYPIVSFQVSTLALVSKTVTPVVDTAAYVKSELPHMVVAAGEDAVQKKKTQEELSNPDSWFPGASQKKVVTPVNSYTLSIPKLRIKNAIVIIAGDDLNNGLIHYGGTAMPGEFGTTVIFGHSTLPQFYDPTNYHTIFSLLPTLKIATDIKEGDDIFITYDGATYRYSVYDMVVTRPDDLSSLEQKYDDSYVTLVTCVPPGTYWQRLHVKAKLMPLQ
jgi:sortase A